MASLNRKPIRIRDPKTGKKVKGTARKWWGRHTDVQGREKRVPLAADKRAAQAMLNDLVKRVERELAGLIDPVEEQLKRPLTEHLDQFEMFLGNKGNTQKQMRESMTQIRKMARSCKWRFVSDIPAGGVIEYLAQPREDGRSAQTHNHYLKAIKQFTR